MDCSINRKSPTLSRINLVIQKSYATSLSLDDLSIFSGVLPGNYKFDWRIVEQENFNRSAYYKDEYDLFILVEGSNKLSS